MRGRGEERGRRRLTEAEADVQSLRREHNPTRDREVHHPDGVHGPRQHPVHVAPDDRAKAPERRRVRAVEERRQAGAALAPRRRRLRRAPRQERPAGHQPRQRGHGHRRTMVEPPAWGWGTRRSWAAAGTALWLEIWAVTALLHRSSEA
jgi:hypothetical protein